MAGAIYPCLWFDNKAQEAAAYYCSIFRNARMGAANDFAATFFIGQTRFMALNGGPQFHFNEAVSFVIECEDQEEIDEYWHKLTADGGSTGRCGWCKDKYQVSWQVVPVQLGMLLSNPAYVKPVMAALMKMDKLEIEVLENAAKNSV